MENMTNIKIEKRRKTYVVIADTERFGKSTIMFESYKLEDCKEYIGENEYTLSETYEDANINIALEKVTEKIGLPINCKIEYNNNEIKKEEEICNSRKGYEGYYNHINNQIVLKENASIKTIIHEIGHYIHCKYLNDKMIKFSKDNKTNYANKNYLENFAECFTDYIIGKENSRTQKMDDIMKSII